MNDHTDPGDDPLTEERIKNRRATTPPPRNLVTRFKDRRLLSILCGVLLFTNILGPMLVASIMRKPQLVIMADEGGNMIIAPGMDFKAASKLHQTSGVLAAQSLLNCSPAGFDSPEMVANLYMRGGRKKADQYIAETRPDFERKSMHQKVEVSHVSVTSVTSRADIEVYYIEVHGQVIRDGTIGGRFVREVDELKMTFEMWRNPRLTENGRYPLVVNDFQMAMVPTNDRPPESTDKLPK